MKRIIAFSLTLLLVFALVACGGETEQTESFSVSESSKQDTSVTESSVAVNESSEAVNESSEAATESSEAVSEGGDESEGSNESNTETETAPAFIGSFVSFGTVDTKVNANSQNALRITGVDVDLSYGAIVLYSEDFGSIEADEVSDFAVAIFTYNHEKFEYLLTDFAEVGKSGDFEAPEDGFAVAIHKTQTDYINRVKELSKDTPVFPHGVHLYDDVDYSIDKTSKAPTIDGVFNSSEWKDFHIEDVDSENHNWSYAQFEVNQYYATASYYVTYDDEYLYLCVVVDSPYHYCPLTQSSAGDMWQYECIQLKMSSESPAGDYILENFDRATNKKAEEEGVVRNYGFAVNDNGETIYYESGITNQFTGKVACSRDDSNQKTVYEVALPFAEYGITPKKGTDIGLTFSINSTNQEDVNKNVWKNITYRNGGGIIGRNDWTKIPVVTLD